MHILSLNLLYNCIYKFHAKIHFETKLINGDYGRIIRINNKIHLYKNSRKFMKKNCKNYKIREKHNKILNKNLNIY